MDQNDNRPVFRQEAFSGRVLEGAVPGEAGGLRRAWGALSPSEGPGRLSKTFSGPSERPKVSKRSLQG